LTLRVEVGGTTHVVEARRGRIGFEVALDGRAVAVDVVAAGSRWSLLLDGRSYEVVIDETAAGLSVHLDGHAVPVRIGGVTRFGRGGTAADAGSSGPRRITAPMPGRIVKVLVQPGDHVAARQGLIVVEAMKMENELRAPAPGRISEVRVTEGAKVEANAVLVVLE
jgi:biotin carboxyl carrier protein